MKILLCPDSFKGSLSAEEASRIMEKAVKAVLPDAETLCVPLADGGEGSIDCLGADKVAVRVSDPFLQPIDSFYGKLDGKAIIESAAAIGLPLVGEHKDPMNNTSYGLGQLIRAALDNGERDIVICLGGSATSDGGAGALAALGASFYHKDDPDGKPYIPTGGTLSDIDRLNLTHLDARLKDARFTLLCDVTNPLYGKTGAAYVFAPQKGASEEDVVKLDAGLMHLAGIIKKASHLDVSALEGGGAAGGIAASFYALLGADIKSGIETLLDLRRFDRLLEGADLVLTGEGRFDSQSLGGKAVGGVAKRAAGQGVPTVVIAGGVLDFDYGRQIAACFPIVRRPIPLADALNESEAFLFHTVKNAVSLFACAKGR